jgi:hypothetical protein
MTNETNLRFSVDQIITDIDGVKYKLTRIESEKPKLPTWAELNKTKLGEEVTVFPRKYANKATTFIHLLEVADYLNEGWVPDWENDTEKWCIINEHGKPRVVVQWHSNYSPIWFKTSKLAETAIEIFKFNDCEQDLIDFYIK